MSIFNILKNKSKTTNSNNFYAVTQGNAMPINQVPDELFSEGVLGDGLGIESDDGIIYAPSDCEVIQIADTKHAIGLKSNGIELLIHVGIDTVALNGDGFNVFVKENQKLKRGDKILKADLDKIKNSGYKTVVIVVVTNVDKNVNYSIVKNSGFVTTNDIIIEI